MLLAERGARVVVNDLGGSVDGVGADAGPAATVAGEIVSAGGVAIADASDVSTVDGAEALIATAVHEYGRVDVLVNNAGIVKYATFPKLDADNLASHLAVHVGGSFNTTRAAWPHMSEAGYGRIVMTTSSGIFGMANNLSYATAKAAVIGMTRSLAVAGADHGIKVNLIAPAAFTRMAGNTSDEVDADDPAATSMSPGLVAPMVGFLAHERCPVTGELYEAGGGRFSRIFIGETRGQVVTGEPTIEDVAEHWAAIGDETGYVVPTDLMSWSAGYLEHLGTDGAAPASS